MGADPPNNPGEGHGSAYYLQGFLELTFGDKGNVALSVNTSRAGNPAGGNPLLFYCKDGRDCLAEWLIDCFLHGNATLVLAIYFHRADNSTISASGTLVPIYVRSFSSNSDSKIPYLTRNLLQL